MAAKPKYRQIADTLREQIREGVLKPGDALPTNS
ncbi:GntR family transcriptional regulator, partial [Leptospira borgpetersenii serovar Ballum]|nr:GntR family transcriptional regulator [Leptospira borgpetersenii serovar Ballum]